MVFDRQGYLLVVLGTVILCLMGCQNETAEVMPTVLIPIEATAIPTGSLIPANMPSRQPSATAINTSFPSPSPATPPLSPSPAIPSPTIAPPPEGYILFFWDVDTYIGNDIPANDAQQDLFLAIPGEAAADWSVHRILQGQLDWPNETPSWPVIAVSPDQTKLAFTVGKCSIEGGCYQEVSLAYDLHNIYVYDLQNGSLTKITNDSSLDFAGLSWSADSQSLIYAWGKELYRMGLNGLPAEQLTASFEQNVGIATTSPDGNHLLVRQIYDGFLFNQGSRELLPIPCYGGIWSSDSQWLACGNLGRSNLSLFNTSTQQQIQLMEPDHYSAEAWSPITPQLAFTEYERESPYSILWLWDSTILTTRQLFTGDSISKPIWSPDGSELFISYHSTEETAHLKLINTITGNSQDLRLPDDIQPFRPLSWSSDGEWVIFTGIYTPAQEGVVVKNHYGLFILNRNSNISYLVYDMGEENIYRGYWLAELDLFWLLDPPPPTP
jgi:hypothetical protein